MIDYDSVMKALEEEYQWQDHEKVAHEMLNVVKYFPTVETPNWIPCSGCERRCDKWENSKTLQE